jgi:hypothetical protein
MVKDFEAGGELSKVKPTSFAVYCDGMMRLFRVPQALANLSRIWIRKQW